MSSRQVAARKHDLLQSAGIRILALACGGKAGSAASGARGSSAGARPHRPLWRILNVKHCAPNVNEVFC